MNQNPYQPPPPGPASAQDGSVKRPWYETQPADWERTATVCWLAAVFVLLVCGFISLPPESAEAYAGLRWIPGPEVVGVVGYVGVALILAIVPAVCVSLLHYAAMQLSSYPLYRKFLLWVAMSGGVVLTIVACAMAESLVIR